MHQLDRSDGISRPSWLPLQGAKIGVAASVLRSVPHLALFLETQSLHVRSTLTSRLDGVVGWGQGMSALRGLAFAAQSRLPFWVLEDGFLRSVGLGKQQARAFSLIIDDLGVYYDASCPSRLEAIIANEDSAWLAALGRAARERVVSDRLTKYNHLPDRPVALAAGGQARILLVDQVAGDRSIAGALASQNDFRRMIDTARRDRPGARLIVRVHPDVTAGLAAGVLTTLAQEDGLEVLDDLVSPHAVLDVVDEVWTVSSQLGFEAMMRGIPVTVFGVPFYAGYGLTDDRPDNTSASAALARRAALRPSLDALVGAALVRYPRYVDPVRERIATFDEAADRLVAERRRHLSLPDRAVCAGFSPLKRRIVRRLLGGPGKSIMFAGLRSALDLARAKQAAVCIDETETGQSAEVEVRAAGTRVLRLQEGFLRATGFDPQAAIPPLFCVNVQSSLAAAQDDSDLVRLLAATELPPALVARARALRETIMRRAATANGRLLTPDLRKRLADLRQRAEGKKVILVPEPMEVDASSASGSPAVRSTAALLEAVRADRPDHFLVYKAHADVATRNRAAGRGWEELRDLADAAIADGPILPLIDLADEVHVLSSPAGFQALLYGKPVVTWGTPFFAGWGVTEDRLIRPRRRLSLDELTGATLILYPHYIYPRTLLPCEPEDLIAFEDEQAVKYGAFPQPIAQFVRSAEYSLRMTGIRLPRF
ncbi:capsular polysaccharide biosynthesis protein [Labrys wisconsinensis]|uniref:Capsular polysaccharide export protein n=1 Tax=Labrys wisconsinensis TaxID=425677 RepID=A0ABU0J6R5_9HYPH|nr:capsular polysaccharide biosynthesis protein [Labrys wisconsinensis]MDQ0469939.1 capsular polysaccharide export protein [Labrys wisconsinensis]